MVNLLFFVFRVSFLPKYRVKYYDYIVKWCGGLACDWCASLDIALKTGYIEFAMTGTYWTIGIVQMCSHWGPWKLRVTVADSEPWLPWQPPG